MRRLLLLFSCALAACTTKDTDVGTAACAIPPGASARIRELEPGPGRRCTRLPHPLAAPRDVVEAHDGTIYVTEMAAGRLSRLDDTGLTTIAEGLAAPIGVRELPDGALVVAEEGGRIERFDPKTHARATLAEGLGPTTYLDLDGTTVLASRFGDLTSPTGHVDRIAGGVVAPFASGLVVPEGIAVERPGVAVVSEWGASPSRLVRVAPPAAPEIVASGFVHLYGVVRGPRADGFVVADVGGDRVAWIHGSGAIETVLDGIAAPAGLWLAKNGDLWIAEHVDGDGHQATGYLVRVSGL